MNVYIVSLEWNMPPAEVTGDPGIESVFAEEGPAQACALETRRQRDAEGQSVLGYSMAPGRHCGHCGEHAVQADGTPPVCDSGAGRYDDPAFCDQCGAELTETGTCDNDHEDWDVDVHCTAWPVTGHPSRRPRTPAALMAVLPEMVAALTAAEALCERALPKFNWAGSALDAEAIQILNDAPARIAVALQHAQEAIR